MAETERQRYKLRDASRCILYTNSFSFRPVQSHKLYRMQILVNEVQRPVGSIAVHAGHSRVYAHGANGSDIIYARITRACIIHTSHHIDNLPNDTITDAYTSTENFDVIFLKVYKK